MVQRRAARWVTNRYHITSSVSDMLHTLGWRSLEHRRATSRLCMLFQIYHGSILASYTILISSHTDILHDPHVKQIYMQVPSQHIPVQTNYFKCPFFPQTIVAWNALPKSVSLAPHWMHSRWHWGDRYIHTDILFDFIVGCSPFSRSVLV